MLRFFVPVLYISNVSVIVFEVQLFLLVLSPRKIWPEDFRKMELGNPTNVDSIRILVVTTDAKSKQN